VYQNFSVGFSCGVDKPCCEECDIAFVAENIAELSKDSCASIFRDMQ